MSNGYMGHGNLPGEREETKHGVVNDITVPTLRWRGLIICDEIMIAAALVLLPLGATVLKTWVLPVFATILVALLFRRVLDNAETIDDVWVLFWRTFAICLVVFIVTSMAKDAVSARLVNAGAALWQWPPQIGQFLHDIAFLGIPFLIPIFTRTPLLANYFKTTLLDPTWPSPRMARDIEGIQYPDVYDDDEPDRPSVRFPIMSLLHRNKRGAVLGLDEWFSPEKDSDGLAKFGKAILEGAATFSEKGSKKTSKHPKQGALHYGYTQAEYVRLRQIGEDLELVEKNGVGYKLTDKGKEAMVGAIVQVLGVDAVPDEYAHLI